MSTTISNNVTNVLKPLTSKIDSLPKHPGDLNIICTIVYKEYQAKKAIVGAFELPIVAITRGLSSAINLVNDETYNLFIQTLTALDSQLKKLLPFTKAVDQIEMDVLKVGQLLSQTCVDFLSNLPESLFNMFQELNNGLFDPTLDLLNLPMDLAGGIMDQILALKQEALEAALGTLYGTLLIPFIEYEQFVKSNGVLELLQEMKALETCMMKPGICHRPRSGFVHQASNKLWSKYYMDAFLIDPYGNLNLNKLISDPRKESQLNTILTRSTTFMTTI